MTRKQEDKKKAGRVVRDDATRKRIVKLRKKLRILNQKTQWKGNYITTNKDEEHSESEYDDDAFRQYTDSQAEEVDEEDVEEENPESSELEDGFTLSSSEEEQYFDYDDDEYEDEDDPEDEDEESFSSLFKMEQERTRILYRNIKHSK